MTKSALEEMEAGGVAISNKYGSRRFWGITFICSIAVMVISLLIFCLTGKANNMEDSTAYTVIYTGKVFLLVYVMLGAIEMRWGRDLASTRDPRQEVDPVEMVAFELVVVVVICIITLWLGKIVEVFMYTMAFMTGLVAFDQLDSPTFDKNHLWLIIGVGTVTGLTCLIPTMFFILGWFSIFFLTYVFIVRFNFPDKTLVEVFAIVSKNLASFDNWCRS